MTDKYKIYYTDISDTKITQILLFPSKIRIINYAGQLIAELF